MKKKATIYDIVTVRKQRISARRMKSLLFLASFCLLAVLLFTGFSVTGANAQDTPFITIWQTDNPGTSDDAQIIIPGEGTDYTIEWEEVDNPDNNGSETGSGEHTLTFPSEGTYRVSISGDFSRINFGTYGSGGGGDTKKIIDVEQWGDIAWTSMEGAFRNTENLDISAGDAPDLSSVTNMAVMFHNASSMNGEIGHWDTEQVTFMIGMFWNAVSFNRDITSWNTGNVTNMNAMFQGAGAFNQEIGSWNVSNVTSMVSLFDGATSFNKDVGGWDTGNVTNFRMMFHEADSFNQDISGWDTGSVTDMSLMFAGAVSFNHNLGSWNTGSVTNMRRMFDHASTFNHSLGSWNVSRVNNMERMLDGTNLSTSNYDNVLISWADQDLQSNVVFGASGLQYCHAETERQYIADEFDWNITDDGFRQACLNPGQIVLLTPGDGDFVNPETVVFDWDIVDAEVNGFKFQLALNEDFTELVDVDSPVTDSGLEIDGLDGGSKYWWRVAAADDADPQWSETRTFEVRTTGIEDDMAQHPKQFDLFQNYPNPFNPVTRIRYTIAEPANVRLSVYDALGRQVTVLVSEQQSPGSYDVPFDASRLSSGMYIYRITAGEFTRTRQMLLVK